MIYLLDTNACIVYLNNSNSGVMRRLQSLSPQDIAVCSVVKAELFYGANRSKNRKRTLALQQKFLDNFISLPFADTAAIALANNLILVTHNTREFNRIANLKIEDWQKE